METTSVMYLIKDCDEVILGSDTHRISHTGLLDIIIMPIPRQKVR